MSEETMVQDSVQDDSISSEVEVSDDAVYEEGGSEGVQADTVDELEEELQEAADAGATKEELQNMVKEFELKVNGKTIKRSLDLSDEDAIKRELQKAYAGQQAMQQKAELENALRTQVDEWKRNPWKFFEQMGVDADELAEMRINQRLEELKKDPAELEREQRERELEELRQQLKNKEEQEQRREYERMQEEAAMALDNEISEALDAHPSLVASPRVIKQIADTLYWATSPVEEGGAGYDPDEISVKDILPIVEKEIKKDISDLFANLPEQFIEEFIGNKGLERMKKNALEKAKKSVPKSAKSLNKPPAPKPQIKQEPAKKRRLEDFFNARNR